MILVDKAENKNFPIQSVIGSILLALVFIISFVISRNNFSNAAIWLAACSLGFIFQKSRFCFAASFRDLFLFGSGQNMKGVLIAIAVSSIGFVGILSWILPNPLPGEFPSAAHVLPVGISTIVAGTLFGIGMVTAGGCVSGTIYRVAEGYIASMVTMLGIFIGAILLIISWDFWWNVFISKEPKIFLPSTFSIGFGFSLVITLLLLLLVYFIVLYIETKSGITNFVFSKNNEIETKGFYQKIIEIINKLFVKNWSTNTGGLALGFVAIIYFLFHSPPGVTGEIMKQSINISEALNFTNGPMKGISSLSGCLGGIDQGIISHTFVSTIGVFFGALVSALLSKEFKIRTPKEPKRYLQSISGGVLMGYSATLGIGCTIGAFFSAVSSFSLSGWVFGISLALGAFIGTKIIKFIG